MYNHSRKPNFQGERDEFSSVQLMSEKHSDSCIYPGTNSLATLCKVYNFLKYKVKPHITYLLIIYLLDILLLRRLQSHIERIKQFIILLGFLNFRSSNNK